MNGGGLGAIEAEQSAPKTLLKDEEEAGGVAAFERLCSRILQEKERIAMLRSGKVTATEKEHVAAMGKFHMDLASDSKQAALHIVRTSAMKPELSAEMDQSIRQERGNRLAALEDISQIVQSPGCVVLSDVQFSEQRRSFRDLRGISRGGRQGKWRRCTLRLKGVEMEAFEGAQRIATFLMDDSIVRDPAKPFHFVASSPRSQIRFIVEDADDFRLVMNFVAISRDYLVLERSAAERFDENIASSASADIETAQTYFAMGLISEDELHAVLRTHGISRSNINESDTTLQHEDIECLECGSVFVFISGINNPTHCDRCHAIL